MLATLHAAWALLSKPMLLTNSALMLASALLFRWSLPQLPGRIPLRLDLWGRPTQPGNPEGLWLMGAIMLAALSLPTWAALAASSGLLDPSRRREHRPLLVANRRNIVRVVESLVLGTNLAIASGWVTLSLGPLPGQRTVPLTALPSVSLLAMLLAMGVPALVVLPKHIRLHRRIQAMTGSARPAPRRNDPTPVSPRTSTPAQWLPPRLFPRPVDQRPHRVPMWLALLVLPSLALWLGLRFYLY